MNMTNEHNIAEAVEIYGESAVSDVIAKNGTYHEIVTLFDIEAGMKLLKLSKFETEDGKVFKKKEQVLPAIGKN